MTTRSRRSSIEKETERYLRTGDSDPLFLAWPGQSALPRIQNGHQDLTDELVAEVLRRSGGSRSSERLGDLASVQLTRQKVGPMIRGLFRRAEVDAVLRVVEDSVEFLTPATIESVLRRDSGDLHTAWDIANLYLGSIGAELLGVDAPRIVGMSVSTSCFVSPLYFDQSDPFEDFVVHEVAHIFHNCKRRDAGLKQTRRREWLLDIEFSKRETFAYACEAHSCILERASSPVARRELATEYGRVFRPSDKRVDPDELADIVLEASGRRNGWKVILGRCAPPARSQRSRPDGEAE